jgi:alpha-L-arabinofuranosidase
VLASADLKAENSLDEPLRVAPAEKAVTAASGGFELTLDAQSFSVLRAKFSK